MATPFSKGIDKSIIIAFCASRIKRRVGVGAVAQRRRAGADNISEIPVEVYSNYSSISGGIRASG